MTRPTRKAMACSPRSARLARWVAAAILASSQLGGREQLAALACTLGGQQRIAAHDEPLPGELRAGEFDEVALVEQRRLEGAVLGGQLRDVRCAQARDPVLRLRAQHLLDARRGQHAAVTHPGHALDAESFLELAHLGGHGTGVARVAGEHLHRDGRTAGRAHEAEDDLRVIALAIA